MSDPTLPYHVLKSELEKQLERNRMLLIQQAHEEEVRSELKAQLVSATQSAKDLAANFRESERKLIEAIRKLSYGCASEQDFMDFHNRQYELERERDQLKAELEQFHEVNFRQAQKINDINGARNAFYNELAQALGIDPQNEENPSIVGEIKKIKAELSESRKSGKKLNAQVLKISDWLDLTIKHRDQWHDLSVKMFDVCMEVAAHGSCDCNIPEGIQCDFCVAGECVSQFNAMEKGKV